jgi:DNA topoisomerase-1
MVELIITEKPSSAKKVAAALADKVPIKKSNKQTSYFELTHNKKKIYVTSAVGHLYGLVESKDNKWQYPVFDIKWQESYKSHKDLKYVKGYIDTIKDLAKKSDEFTVACDFDVEGEVIGLNVVRFACKQKDANRMKFSTLTKGDLVKSYNEKLNHLDWGQAYAGETRHKLDWFFGINMSRALTASVKAAGSFKVMSAGRVQGPALKILVDREKEIQAFIPEPFWLIKLDGLYKKEKVEAGHIKDKIFDKKVVDKILKNVKGQKQASITSIKRTKRKQQPPTPFDLTTLQSESYAHFKITPKDTLALAQVLYLAGVTSYPRTSSQQLDPKIGFQKILTDLMRQPMYKGLAKNLLDKKVLTPNNGKKKDPAHPAIYPTGLTPENLKPREQKIYDIVVKRFLATFADPAVRETMEVRLDVNKEEFVTKGTRTVEENWHIFYKPYVKLEEISLPDMKEKEIVDIKKIEKEDKETQPPNRYNQSSIIKELEKRNLGTKATRADILDRLFKRGYIEGVKITASKLGIETVGILEKFVPKIIDEKLTAEIEEDMQKIRDGTQKQEAVLEKSVKFLKKELAAFKKKEKEIGTEIIKSVRETIQDQNFCGKCFNCGDGNLQVRRGKFGRFIGCDKYPDCKTIINIPNKGVLKYKKTCEECKYPIISLGTGRQKREKCMNEKCSTNNDGKAASTKKIDGEGNTCPTCNVGKLVLRKGFYGQFLGCNNYPKCKTIVNIKEGKADMENPIVKK